MGPSAKIEDIQDKVNPDQTRKVWQFNSPLGYQLNILTDSLDITSQYHKTYDNPKSDNRFKDIIQYVLEPFFKISQLPVLGRVGLRYIDECPFPTKTTECFRSHFNSCFDTDRFSIETATELQYKAVAKRGNYSIRYVETLKQQESSPVLILDFDGFALNVQSAECVKTTDDLHILISEEYERTIKEPVYNYMRKVEHN